MTFFEIIISLALERIWPGIAARRRFGGFTRFSAWAENRIGAGGDWKGAAAVLLAVLPPVLATAVLYSLLGGLLGLLAFVFAIAVLLLCLGPADLDAETRSYIAARQRGDEEEARRRAIDLAGAHDVPADAVQLTRAVVEAVLTQANERIFAVLFWFAVLGPAGAVFYRLSSLLNDRLPSQPSPEQDAFADAARRLHGILGWLPARLAAFGYAVTGSFADAMYNWSSHDSGQAGWLEKNDLALAASGLGSLHMDSGETSLREGEHHHAAMQVRAALALVWRTVALWLAVILAVEIAGWVI
ncbi:MAG: regulatory signaling modulator protein AmpE [Pseudomonadota bacterium]